MATSAPTSTFLLDYDLKENIFFFRRKKYRIYLTVCPSLAIVFLVWFILTSLVVFLHQEISVFYQFGAPFDLVP